MLVSLAVPVNANQHLSTPNNPGVIRPEVIHCA